MIDYKSGTSKTSDGNYRMSSALKTRLSLGKFESRESRNSWKRLMIGAELEASKPVRGRSDAGKKNDAED